MSWQDDVEQAVAESAERAGLEPLRARNIYLEAQPIDSWPGEEMPTGIICGVVGIEGEVRGVVYDVTWLDEVSTEDMMSFDPDPDDCWRCDARTSDTDVGLCLPCHHDMTTDR